MSTWQRLGGGWVFNTAQPPRVENNLLSYYPSATLAGTHYPEAEGEEMKCHIHLMCPS